MSLTRQPAKRRTLARTRLRANRQVINSCYISVTPKLSPSPEGGRTVTRVVRRAEGRFGSTIAVFFHSWFDRCKGQRDRLLSTGSNPANAGEGRPHGSDPPGTHPAPIWAPPGNIFRIPLNIFRSRPTRRAPPPARGNSGRTGVLRSAGLCGPNRSFLGGPARGVICNLEGPRASLSKRSSASQVRGDIASIRLPTLHLRLQLLLQVLWFDWHLSTA